MNLRCQDALERLVEGLTGTLPPDQRAEVIEHLATCARCRDEAAAMEALVTPLREAGRFTTPPGFWGGFMDGLQHRLAHERLPLAVRFRRWLAQPRYAAVTAVVTVVMVVLISTAVRQVPRPAVAPDPVLVGARGLVTETMTTTLPSLGEILDIWKAGLPSESDLVPEGTERKPR